MHDKPLRVRIFIGMVVLLMAAPALSQEVISMGSDEWLPYVGTQENRGYMIEVADAIFAKQGIKIQIRSYPWARILHMVRKGSLHAAPGMQKHQAPDFIIPNEPLGIDEAAFFVHKSDQWKYKNSESLNDKKLGVIKNYTYEKEIDAYVANNLADSRKIHVVHGDDPYAQIVKLLQAKRVDMIVANPNVFFYKLSTMGLNGSDYKKIPIPNSTSYVYIGFSPALKQSREYAKILSTGITEMRKNGQLENILKKYRVNDWK
jgi:polar amino acid transport system substrate-binding protein